MSSPSSTSSSDHPPSTARTLQLRPRVPWDWVLAIAFLIAIDRGVEIAQASHRLPEPREWKSLVDVKSVVDAVAGAQGPHVVLCGSSTVARLSPEIVARELAHDGSKTVISTGLPGANTAAVLYALEHLVLARMQPMLLVYGLDTQSVNEHGLRRREQSLVIGTIETATESEYRWTALWILHDHCALFRNQFLLRSWIVHPWRMRWGVRPPPRPPPPGRWTLGHTPLVYEAEARHELGPSARREIAALVALASARGIRVVLANMPLPPEYAGYWEDGPATYERYRAALRELARDLAVPFVDLDDGSYEKVDFLDSHHLSGRGGERASRALGEALRPLLR